MKANTILIGLLSSIGFAYVGYVVHAGSVPFVYKVRTDYDFGEGAYTLPDDGETRIGAILAERFGTPNDPIVAGAEDRFDPERLRAGQKFYFANCLHCHGPTGRGDGPTAAFLDFERFGTPAPRDYTRGIFKFGSADAIKPHREDILRTIRHGLEGSTMPSFALYRDSDLEGVTDYVIHLAIRGEVEERLARTYSTFEELAEADVDEAVEGVLGEWAEAQDPANRIEVPEPPPFSMEGVERGRRLFLSPEVNCQRCHGPQGRGDGEEADSEQNRIDAWGNEILPRDLTAGVYRRGGRPRDLYLTVRLGIPGTSMPAFGNLTEEQIWDLVHFVRALPLKEVPE